MTPYTRATSQLLSIVILLGWTTIAAAQGEPPAEPTAPAMLEPGGVRELAPLHLIDKNGQLVPVYRDISLEEWEELRRAKLELATPDVPPRYSIDSLRIEGRSLAESMQVNVSLDLTVTATGWVRIPLRMSRAVLNKPLECPPNEQCFVEYAKEGYVLWLKVAPPDVVEPVDDPAESTAEDEASESIAEDESDEPTIVRQQRSFEFQMALPLTTKAGESELVVDLPRKMVRSEVSLLIDERLKFMAPQMVKMTREPAEAGIDRVSLTGVSGELRLRWVVPPDDVTDTELDVRTLILSEISGPRLIRSTARLRVRNLAGPLLSFNVLLPPNMQLEKLPPGAQFTVANAEDKQLMRADDRQLVTITLNEPSSETIEVVIVGVATRTQREQFSQFDITGFEVLGAKLQSGYHALSVSGDWYLHWTGDSGNLRQVDIIPDEDLERELGEWQAKNVIARFRQLSVPSSLRVRVTPQRTLIQVEASHVVFVSNDQLRLESELKFRIRGRKIELIDLDLGQWQSAEVGPEELIRLEAVVDSEGMLTVPLQQATGGEFVVKLSAAQPLAPEQDRFSFELPSVKRSQPEREELNAAPATVAIVADDDLRVTPISGQLQGLTPSAGTPFAELPEREQPPRIYRQRTADEIVKFAANKVALPQSISVESLTRIESRAAATSVNMRLQYNVMHRPIEWLTLAIPKELVADDRIQANFQLGSMPVVATLLPATNGQPPTAEIQLPEAQSGSFEVTVNYDWPATDPAEAGVDRIGIVRPSDDLTYTSIQNHLTLLGAELTGTDAATRWKRSETSAVADASSGVIYTTDSLTPQVAVRTSIPQTDTTRATRVSVAWYQSWLTSLRRRDRAVFHVETDDDQVDIEFPPEGDFDRIEVAVNGKPQQVDPVTGSDRSLTIPVRKNATGAVVLEIVYEVSEGRSGTLWNAGIDTFDLPSVKGVVPGRSYWQLVLPSDEYLWMEPSGMTSELPRTLPWTDSASIAAAQQRNLEELTEATPTQPPAASANVYLFSGFGESERLSVGLLPRRGIVLLGAGLVLVLSLPLIYLPSLRGWKAMLAAGIVVLLLGLAYPYPALLLGSAAIVGCLLALLARLLQITLSRERRGPQLLPRRSVPAQRTSADIALDGDAGSHATTATAPAIFAPPLGDQEAS